MQKTIGFALVMVGLWVAAPIASAQVVIQGEVTTTTTSGYPQQQQPPPYGYQQQQQPVGYGGQSVYVQQPGAQSPQPMRYIHHSDPIGGLVAGGVIGLGAGFVFTLVSELVLAGGYSSGCSGYGCPDDTWYALSWIPIIGPWLGLGIGRGGDYEWVNYVGGILEDAGLVLLILGLVIHDEWDEPMYAFGEGRDAPAIWLRGNGLALTF